MPQVDPDHALRSAAISRARELADRYDDLVPLAALREGFEFAGKRVSFGSFQRGIHRPAIMKGAAALSLLTAPKVPGKQAPYDDLVDFEGGAIVYHYRTGSIELADNRALLAAHAMQVPLVYFHGVASGQYMVVAPVFVVADDRDARCVLVEVGLPVADMSPSGPISTPDVRAYAMRDVKVRLHQQRFRIGVLRAYRHRCAICSLRERALVQAAHIVSDASAEGIAAVVNGLALCAIHHLAYDRNLLGIDPAGVVHIGRRLRDEHDGPMLREGLQGFHGRTIALPKRVEERPDPTRLAVRFAEFEAA